MNRSLEAIASILPFSMIMKNMEGIVQLYEKKKGYGYIRVPSTREEFYVHKKHIAFSIAKGDQVLFDLMEDKHGLSAINIRQV